MRAWVAVVPHPFFAVTGEDGRYEIRGLPAGTYTVEAWHERLPAQTFAVTVADGDAKAHDVVFDASAAAGPMPAGASPAAAAPSPVSVPRPEAQARPAEGR